MTCGTCRFWNQTHRAGIDADKDGGECRRYLSTASERVAGWRGGVVERRVWPRTDADEWCGDYREATLAEQARRRRAAEAYQQ
jgi:hypothetical protein